MTEYGEVDARSAMGPLLIAFNALIEKSPMACELNGPVRTDG